jgi:plasmid stability protein
MRKRVLARRRRDGPSLVAVTTSVHFPEDLAQRLAAKAARRHVSAEELAVELVSAGLDGPEASSVRRRLAFAAVGASGSTRGAEADELLAEGFGRD